MFKIQPISNSLLQAVLGTTYFCLTQYDTNVKNQAYHFFKKLTREKMDGHLMITHMKFSEVD